MAKRVGRPTEDEATRFWSKVDKNGPLPLGREFLGPCWLWTAGGYSKGYGGFSRAGRAGGTVGAHVWAWTHFTNRPVPKGFQLDHLCRVRRCVNPAHLEVVTGKINVLRGAGPTASNGRKTHCNRGHEFTPENTYLIPSGGRACKECRRLQRRTYRQTPAGREQHRQEERQRNQRRRNTTSP